MQYKTKELNLTLHPNNVLEITSTEEAKGKLTLEEVDNNLAILEKATKGKTTASLVVISSTYVKKEVLKKYSDLDYGIIASALLVNSYGSKLVGNLFLTLFLRFSSRQIPTKVFTNKEEAVKWLEDHLEKEKQSL